MENLKVTLNESKLAIVQLFLIILILVCTFCLEMSSQTREEKMNEQNAFELFSLIQSITKSFPLTKEKMESLFKTPIQLVQENDYVQFFEGGSIHLANDVIIEKIDLRLHKTRPNDKGFIVLNITNACIKLEEIKDKYGMLEITDSPRGRSLYEVTSYSTLLPWGKISFSFAEIKRDCLCAIILNPQAKSLYE